MKLKLSEITEELKNEMCNEYINNSELRISELCEKYNIHEVYFQKIRKEKGISKRSYPKTRSNLISCNENYFETIDSADKSYWLGFIAADGCIKRDGKYLQLVIRLASKDSSHLEKFKKDIEADQKIIYTETYDVRTNKIYTSSVIRISRRKTCEDLIKHGVGPNKSKELSIPKTIPENFIRDFIRGYSDGDASFNFAEKNNIKRIRYSIISSTKSLLEEIQNIFNLKCDIKPTKITIYPNNSAYKIYYQTDKVVKKIYDYLYENNKGPYLDRKYELATNHFNSEDFKINIAKSRK